MGNNSEEIVRQETLQGVPTTEKPTVTDDDHLLMQLGYKPELRRNFSVIQVFGIAFSIMSLLPSIASVLALNLPAGGCATWGWLAASVCILTVGM
ncbi:Uga4p [Sugiyamaella lignohabitans]|uniref:Uga4p n=1 Tax=Sugiyamaella lignohabitans TaxID=796027 RepID=A0A167EY70_9ASCO|nr:Uga4p [Sugiyamaella lignohabitans]ANB14601.1 Uga4p [Sugiyamaella lignohabitans]